jgi:hypothetical protein
MKINLTPLLAGAALLALAGAANAGQPLTDAQMDHVTAGLGNSLVAEAQGAAFAIGNFSSNTVTITNTITDQGEGVSLAEGLAGAIGDSAITASLIVAASDAAAAGVYN